MLQVYLDPCTVNSRKVLAGLDLLGTEFTLNHVNYFTGEHKGEEYLKINPNATVPAAIDGDCAITESNAILQYAADHTHGGNSPAYPKDLKKRADVNKWLLWEASVWFQTCYVYLIEYVVKPLLKAEPDESVIKGEEAKFHKLANVLDQQLGKTKFIAGDEVTIADIAVAAPMHLRKPSRLPLDEHPNLLRWIQEIEKLPCWVKTQGAVEAALTPDDSAPTTTNGTTSNGTMASGHALPEVVHANFNYSLETSKPTEIYFYDHPSASSVHLPGDSPYEMPVYNGWSRNVSQPFSLETEGFSLHPFTTSYNDWFSDESVRSTFYPSIVTFLRLTTGASRVLVFDHTLRSHLNATKPITDETSTSQRAPVMLVHCDYTSESGPLRVKQLLPDEAETLLRKRVCFLNVWKPIHNTVYERPLAMCDVTTSDDEDFFKLYLRYRERDGENYVLKHNPSHKWWYFPEMTTEQVILLKTYDSEEDGRARFVGHTAFEDPTSKEGAPVRESVEIRTICFFD